MKTFSRQYKGLGKTSTICNELLLRSQWFQVEPLPDGYYEITVKEENTGLLISLGKVN